MGGLLGGRGDQESAVRRGPRHGRSRLALAVRWDSVWDDHGRLFFGRDDGRIWAIPAEGTAGGGRRRSARGSGPHAALAAAGRAGAALHRAEARACRGATRRWSRRPLATGERKVLLTDAADARYVPSGHLVFLRRGGCSPCRLMPSGWQLRGPEVPVLDAVAQALTGGHCNDHHGRRPVRRRATGTLAWVPGPVVPYPDRALVTVDRRGQVTRLPAPVRSYAGTLRLSPDGRRLAVTMSALTERRSLGLRPRVAGRSRR